MLVALAIDEVLFPFAREYSLWRSRNGLRSFDPAALSRYDFASVLGDPGADTAHTTLFIGDAQTLSVVPR